MSNDDVILLVEGSSFNNVTRATMQYLESLSSERLKILNINGVILNLKLYTTFFFLYNLTYTGVCTNTPFSKNVVYSNSLKGYVGCKGRV